MSQRSPFTQRVHIALEEARADYTFHVVDLLDRQTVAWYTNVLNPSGKIPTITYGSKGDPQHPPAGSAKIYESLIILEFIADIFPEAKLLPVDPVCRARVRLFVHTFETKVADAFRTFFFAYMTGADSTLLEGLEMVQALLPPSGFAVEEWSLADIAAAPILTWICTISGQDLGTHPAGEGLKLHEALEGPKFARLTKYIEDLQERPTYKSTDWGKDRTIEFWKTYPPFQRN
ncbi:thioredoxin-like protein [Cubamyces menziesii]|nr:thioredoxin-like protein [Cubamyces menziesii]